MKTLVRCIKPDEFGILRKNKIYIVTVSVYESDYILVGVPFIWMKSRFKTLDHLPLVQILYEEQK